jgi:hypothetical protein
MIFKVGSLFQILTWYSYISTMSFIFLGSVSSIWNFCFTCLLTSGISQVFLPPPSPQPSGSGQYHSQSPESSVIKYTWLPSKNFNQSCCVFRWREVQAHSWMSWCWKIVVLAITYLDVAKFTMLTTFALPVLYKLLFTFVGLELFLCVSD